MPSTTEPSADLAAFEKDRKFHTIAQLVNSVLYPALDLDVDEVLLVADRLAEVLAARPIPELTTEQRAHVAHFGFDKPEPESSIAQSTERQS